MKKEFKKALKKNLLVRNKVYSLPVVEVKVLAVAPKANLVKLISLRGDIDWVCPDEYEIVDVLEDIE